jgi:hypothetical protein
MRRRAVPRSAAHDRLCRRCARPVPETEFPAGEWVCAACAGAAAPPAMPLREQGGWLRYDTSKVFAGFKVRKVFQGEGPEYENEVGSPNGEFYAAGEAAVAFHADGTRWLNLLVAEFPGCLCVTRGDDGRGVVLIPVALFPAVARRVRAYRRRVVTDKHREQLARARDKSPLNKGASHDARADEGLGGIFGAD